MSIKINDGASYTNSTSVTLTLTAPAGATRMRFSSDGATFGAWASFSATTSYALPSGDGGKTVSVQFGDGGSTVLGAGSASITLDTAAPTAASIAINGGAADTATRQVALTLDATDGTSPVAKVRLKNDGGEWGAWQTATASVWWTLSDGYGQKTVSAQFQDSAGNESSVVSASIEYVKFSVTGTWLILKTPDYDDATGTQTSYFRIGASDSTTENALLDSFTHADPADSAKTKPGVQNADDLRAGDPAKTYPGWFEYTDGDRTLVVRGNNRESIQLDETVLVGGNKTDTVGGKYRLNLGAGTLEVYNADPVYRVEFFEQDVYAAGKKTWRKREMGHNSSDSYTFGDTESFYGGYKFDAMFGMTNTVFLGGKIDLSLALALTASVGMTVEFGAGLKYSNVAGKEISTAGDHELKAREEIHLRIKADHEGVGGSRNAVLAGIAAATAVPVAVLSGCTAAGTVDSSGVAAVPAGCLGGAAAAFAVGLVASVVVALKDKAGDPRSQAEIKMDKKGILIGQNDAAGATQSAIYVGEDDGGPGAVFLANVKNSYVELDPDADIVVNAGKDIYLQTEDGSAVLKLATGGNIRLKSSSANIQGQITLGANNALTIQ
ncbi:MULTISPECIES: hypothetical protein [Sorangium]|uniref:Uncharacterized protein n=1 Tax=Sorangium cellulosum TaxID=56 RepID=A0A4P2QPL1_SORCE|nr:MULTISPECIES: hypothetical protein [Sorangium]AUX31878.1 uncharacterized protein SOCE836_040110 [Sorangium cellulosum]WCQ91253.1 hypothetical protein NQZ70_03968 [Sorangium sp. Soce836]